ncbi:hypothetical protein IWW36_000926 [Coemansia brasiliensis]|uniref:Uncharacterized protein n=1 Tax=Coemansia brasiliensis TaxID=2650707 RepID=A0A9W8IET0_9FUNG|nr:hypothetical protein IWW36_000926 [Coemansia brasiliensis]
MNLYCPVESPQSNSGSIWLPAFQRPSCSALHSRSSSTSTAVDIQMISSAVPSSPQPPAVSAASLQLRSQLKPALTVPSSPQHPLKQGIITPRLSPHHDSLMSMSDRGDAEEGNQLVEKQPDAGQDCMFDMDSDERFSAAPMLNRSALSYENTGKPQPWTVRRMSLYDSLQAQIRAIDDDDNEFYLS